MFTYITGSPIIGAVLAVLMFAAGLGSILMPDFSKGIFLDMLLDDKEHTKKIAASAKTATIFSSALFDFGFIPIITYFLIVPMASTDLLGPHTSIVTPVLWSITCFSLIPSIFFDLSANLGLEIGRVWDAKINTYIKNVWKILLQQHINDPEANMVATAFDVTDQLAVEHECVEKWAREVIKKTATVNNLNLGFPFVFTVVNLFMIGTGVGGNNRGASTIVLASYSVMTINWFLMSLHSLAQPNLAWETAKVEFLNDPRIQRAIVRIGWSERWGAWLKLHELNASRVYGIKLTTSTMRSVGSAIGSLFTIVMYFLLRNELRNML